MRPAICNVDRPYNVALCRFHRKPAYLKKFKLENSLLKIDYSKKERWR